MPESIRDLRLFVAVYEERSFTAAASRQNITQSGVSQHIKRIEERLNVDLLLRAGGAVVPTPAGDLFYRTCIDLLRSLDDSRARLEEFQGKASGEITLGVTPTIARSVLSQALLNFVSDFPNVNVKVVEGYSDAITEQVKVGLLDFGIVPAVPTSVGVRSHLLGRTPEVLVASSSAPYENRLPLSLRNFKSLKLILPSSAQARRGLLDRYLAVTGARVERVMEFDSMFATLDFVAKTDWVTFLPSIMLFNDLNAGRFNINLWRSTNLRLSCL